ncbi:MAG: hypothetical protein WEB93_00215 [Sphingomonadales bacterium]
MTPDILDLDDEIKTRLKRLLEEQSTVSAGQLVIVGLDPIRDKLGGGWSRYRDRVHTQFDKVVEGILAPSEVSLRIAEDKYVVVFRGRDQAASRVICEKILSQVHEVFLGSPDMGGLSLESVVMTLDPEAFAQTVGVELDQDRKDRAPLQSAPTDSPGPGRKVALTKQKLGLADLDGQDVWYLPAWDMSAQRIYAFLPTVIRTVGRRRVSGYHVLEDPRNPKQIRALDLYLVERALQQLHTLQSEGGNAILTVPVSFDVLDHNESRTAFHRMCVTMPPAVRRRLVFLFTNLSPGRPPWRMAEFATMLGQLGAAVFARIEPQWDNLSRLVGLPFKGVTVDLEDDPRPHDKVRRDLLKVGDFCLQNRLVMGVGGVHDLDLANVAQSVGARFFSGHYILGAVDKPQGNLDLQWMNGHDALGSTDDPIPPTGVATHRG